METINIRKEDIYRGTREDLIMFFEGKYPLLKNEGEREEGKFYLIADDDKWTIRNQIERKDADSLGCIFFKKIKKIKDSCDAIEIEREWFMINAEFPPTCIE